MLLPRWSVASTLGAVAKSGCETRAVSFLSLSPVPGAFLTPAALVSLEGPTLMGRVSVISQEEGVTLQELSPSPPTIPQKFS